MFLTDLLFSSLQLRFSEQQKAAVLNWGKKLGARDVLSASAVKKCQERIKMLVGNPIEKVESNSGTVFYINDIGTAIAKVQSILCLVTIQFDISFVGLCKSSYTKFDAGLSH